MKQHQLIGCVWHITPLYASQAGYRRSPKVPASSKSVKKWTVDAKWDSFDLGELASSFSLGGVPKSIAANVQIRELEAGADVHRGTHHSEGLSHIEPERSSGQFPVPSECLTGL